MRKVLLLTGGCLLIVAGLMTAVTTTLVVFIIPQLFVSTVRILPGVKEPIAIATEVEKLQSKSILFPVITNLNLNKLWAVKFAQEPEIPTEVTYLILKGKIKVGQARRSLLIDIKVYDEDKNEAALIANEIANVFRESPLAIKAADGKSAVQIIDKAEPGLRPVRPNKSLNITIGCGVGAIQVVIGVGLLLLNGRRGRTPPLLTTKAARLGPITQ